MYLRNLSRDTIIWRVFHADDDLMVSAFAEGIVVGKQVVSWSNNSLSKLKVLLFRKGNLDAFFNREIDSSQVLTISDGARVTDGPRPYPRGEPPGVIVRNRSDGPVHVALSWGGVIQQIRNDLPAGEVDFFTTTSTKRDQAGLRQQRGQYDLTVITGLPESRFDSTSHNLKSLAGWTVTLVGGVASIPLAVAGGWAIALAGAGVGAAVGSVVLTAASVKLSSSTIERLSTSSNYELMVTGQEIHIEERDGRPVLIGVEPPRLTNSEIPYLSGAVVRRDGRGDRWWLHDGRRYRVPGAVKSVLGDARRLGPRIFDRYVDSRTEASADGKLARVGRRIWWLYGGLRYPVVQIDDLEVLGGWHRVREVAPSALDGFEHAGVRARAEGRMIRGHGQRDAWWLHDGARYPVRTDDIELLGGQQMVAEVNPEVLNRYATSDAAVSAEGKMLRVADQIWWVRDGVRHRVPDYLVDILGGRDQVHDVASSLADRFPISDRDASMNGKLVRAGEQNEVWFIRGGRRQLVPDEYVEVFGAPEHRFRIRTRTLSKIQSHPGSVRIEHQVAKAPGRPEIWQARRGSWNAVPSERVDRTGTWELVHIVRPEVIDQRPPGV